MRCLAVELKPSQWAFYLIVGILAIVFLIMNVLWYLTTDWGVGALIAMMFCPLVLCYLAFDSFRQYRKAAVTDMSDGDVRTARVKGLSMGTYAVEIDDGEE